MRHIATQRSCITLNISCIRNTADIATIAKNIPSQRASPDNSATIEQTQSQQTKLNKPRPAEF